MRYIKQVIIVRNDLKMPKGKACAQVAHASLGALLDYSTKINDNYVLDLKDGILYTWLKGIFTKVCLKVESEQELLDIYKAAKDLNLSASLIKDAGFTVFPEPTLTCVGIGPYYADTIDKITGHLKLY